MDRDTDYVFLISYGISDPIVDVDVSYYPIFNWVPGQTTYNRGSIGNTQYSSTATTSGNIQYSGSVPILNKSTNYKRYLIVVGFENSKNISDSAQIWKISMQSTGFSDDLRNISGVMFGLMQDYSLQNERTTEQIPVNDPFSKMAFE